MPFLHIGLSTYHAKVYVGNKKREREGGGDKSKGGLQRNKGGKQKREKGKGETKQSDIALQKRITLGNCFFKRDGVGLVM